MKKNHFSLTILLSLALPTLAQQEPPQEIIFKEEFFQQNEFQSRVVLQDGEQHPFGDSVIIFRIKDVQKQTIYLDENNNNQQDENEILLSPRDLFTLTFEKNKKQYSYYGKYLQLFNNQLFFISQTVLVGNDGKTKITIKDVNFDGIFDYQDFFKIDNSAHWEIIPKILYIDNTFKELTITDQGFRWQLNKFTGESVTTTVQSEGEKLIEGKWILQHKKLNVTVPISLNQSITLPTGEYSVVRSDIKCASNNQEVFFTGDGAKTTFILDKKNSKISFSHPLKLEYSLNKRPNGSIVARQPSLVGKNGEYYRTRPQNISFYESGKFFPQLFMKSINQEEILLGDMTYG